MPSQRSQEGYLIIDHREGPGVPDSMLVGTGLPLGAGRGLFEAPTYTCSHCRDVVVINPNRQRERAYCPKCDHRLCDSCGAIRAANGGLCKTFSQVIDEVQEAAGMQRSVAIWTPGS